MRGYVLVKDLSSIVETIFRPKGNLPDRLGLVREETKQANGQTDPQTSYCFMGRIYITANKMNNF